MEIDKAQGISRYKDNRPEQNNTGHKQLLEHDWIGRVEDRNEWRETRMNEADKTGNLYFESFIK